MLLLYKLYQKYIVWYNSDIKSVFLTKFAQRKTLVWLFYVRLLERISDYVTVLVHIATATRSSNDSNQSSLANKRHTTLIQSVILSRLSD